MNLEAKSVLPLLCAAILAAACASTSSSTAGNAGAPSEPSAVGPSSEGTTRTKAAEAVAKEAAVSAEGGAVAATVTSGGPAGTFAQAAPAISAAASSASGLDLAGMDRSVKPGDDFFRFTNGGWYERTEIPPDRSVFGTFSVLSELTAKRTADLITEASKGNAPEGSEARKIGDTYASFLDEERIEQLGLEPLKPTLDAVAAIKDRESLSRYLGGQLRADMDVFNATKLSTDNLFGLWVAQDLDEPSKYAPFLLQGGLALPDRDYYLNPSQRMADLRARYTPHVAAMLKLAGVADADAKAARIVELERQIATVHASRTDSSDVEKGNNHWTRKQLEQKAQGVEWATFLGAAGLDKQPVFVAWQPGAITGIAKLAGSVPIATWKDYLTYHALEHHAGVLPRAFVQEQFEFHGKALTGAQVLRERWKRAIDVTDLALGEAVGKLYVAKWFPASEKARAEQMVKNVIAAFARRIDALDWMAPRTKEKAKAKLAVLKVGVGYPDQWRDYSGLRVTRGEALGNLQRAEKFDLQRALARLGEPVDRSEWVMNPQLVNAVNLPAMNALNFPAAILQPPNFDPTRPEAVDYGAVGAVIGHEICHSFDSEGALFDDTGRLRNWWTPEDFAHFKESSNQLAAQYDAYHPFPDVHVNGRQTLGENIADVAGLAASLAAYHMSLGGKPAPTVAGLTGDQQFFIGFGQTWRSKLREAALRQRLVVDGHAPPEYRADTVRNLDPWYLAFDVKPGEKLYLPPDQRVRVY
jgi:predicted metalloendopeptidase